MTCPKCGHAQPEANTECARCGVIFAKLSTRPVRQEPIPPNAPAAGPADEGEVSGLVQLVKERLFFVEDRVNVFFFGGRALVYLGILIWGIILMTRPVGSNAAGNSFMHLINLPFHEAGHVFFGLFGRFIGVLGGTLGQLLIPLICLTAFIVKGNTFAASVGLWWTGESLIDIAPYINDARAGRLILLGGTTGSESPDFHDWRVILSSLDLLDFDHALAWTAHILGMLMMVAALTWGGWLLFRQYRNLDL